MLAEILTQKLWTCSSCYLLYVTINPRQERLRALSLGAGILSHSSYCPVFIPCLSCFKQKSSPVLKWMSCVAGLFKLSWVHMESGKFLFYEFGPTAVLWQDELNSKIFFGSSVHITVFHSNGLTGFWYTLLFLWPEKLVFNSCLCRLLCKIGCFDKLQAQGVSRVGIWFLEKEKLKQKYVQLCGAVTVQNVLVLLTLQTSHWITEWFGLKGTSGDHLV